jgi:hypothetical protein
MTHGCYRIHTAGWCGRLTQFLRAVSGAGVRTCCRRSLDVTLRCEVSEVE